MESSRLLGGCKFGSLLTYTRPRFQLASATTTTSTMTAPNDSAAAPTTTSRPAVNDRCKVFCAAGDQQLDAVIVATRTTRKRKQLDTTPTETAAVAAEEMEYYVHYVEHDR